MQHKLPVYFSITSASRKDTRAGQPVAGTPAACARKGDIGHIVLQGIRTPPGGWKSAAAPAPLGPATSPARDRADPRLALQQAEKCAAAPSRVEGLEKQPGGASAEPARAADAPERAPRQAGGQGSTPGDADAQLRRPGGVDTQVGGVDAQVRTAGAAGSGSTLEVEPCNLSFTQGFGGASAACASTAVSALTPARLRASRSSAGAPSGTPKQGPGLGGGGGTWMAGAPQNAAFSFQRVGAPFCAGAPLQLLGPGLGSPMGVTLAHALPALTLPRVGETPPRSALFEPSPVLHAEALGMGSAQPPVQLVQAPASGGSPGAERLAGHAAALPGNTVAVREADAHAESVAPSDAAADAQSSAARGESSGRCSGAPAQAPASPPTSRGAAAEDRGTSGGAGGATGAAPSPATAQSPGPATPAAQRALGSLQGSADSAAAGSSAPLDARRLDELLRELGADLRRAAPPGLFFTAPRQCAAFAHICQHICTVYGYGPCHAGRWARPRRWRSARGSSARRSAQTRCCWRPRAWCCRDPARRRPPAAARPARRWGSGG